jgi:GT2 family glycosyltransferase
MVDSKFLKQNDCFDENTFLYYEEQILSIKVLISNKKELVANKVKIIHDHSVSIDKSIKRVKKQKVLKTSQRYFCKEYLKANILQMSLLYITDYFYRGVLYIRCLIRR